MSLLAGELHANLDLDSSRFDRGLRGAESRFRSFGSGLGRMGGMIGGVALGAAAAGVTALGAAMVGGAYAGIRYNSSIQQTTIAMGTMLGSTQKAKALIADVSAMAAKTPFEFPELADTSKRLVAYGFAQDEVVKTMTRLGDISSALNVPLGEMADLYGKARVQGRLYTEDVMQFAGRGVPIFSALAKVMGVNQSEVKGLVEQGKVGFPELEKAIESMTAKGSMFGGMMEKQSKSFAGQWSTIKDNVTQILGKAMQPLFTWLAEEGMPALNRALPKVERAFGTIAAGAKQAWQVARPVLRFLARYLGEEMGKAWPLVKELFSELVDTVQSVVGFIRKHWGTIGPIVRDVWKLVTSIIRTSLKVIANLIGLVMAVIRGDWGDAWNHIKGVLKAVWDGMKGIVQDSLDAIKRILSGLAGKVLGWIGDLGSVLYDAGKALITGLWNGIKDKFNDVKKFIGGIGSWIKDHKGPLDYDRRLLLPAGKAIMQGLQAGMASQMPDLTRFLSRVPDTVSLGLGPRPAFAAAGVTTAPTPNVSPSPTYVTVYLDSEPIAARVEVRQQQKARRVARTVGAFA